MLFLYLIILNFLVLMDTTNNDNGNNYNIIIKIENCILLICNYM